MRTLTMMAHKRPKYTAETISAAVAALFHPGLDEQFIDEFIFSIDPEDEEVQEVCHKAAQVISSNGLVDCVVYVNTQRFGIAGNSFLTLLRAFEEHGSDFNVFLEDDAVLSTDALALAKWFYTNHCDQMSRYTLLSMCNHRDFNQNQGAIPNDPSFIAESAHITSPFAWCMSKWQWPFAKACWDRKKLEPNGWDFSLSYAMRLERRRALHPVLSRCKNVGRVGGEHQTPQSYDEVESVATTSDGSYSGAYKIIAKLDDRDLMGLNDWMRSEYLETFK